MTALETLRAEIEAEYAARTAGSAEFHSRAVDAMPGGDTRQGIWFRPHPLYLRGGSGAWAEDVDGNRYLDVINNMSAMVLGHAHPAIVDAVQAQLALGSGYAAFNTHVVELAELLCERIPSVERIRFCNSGTEATMLAVRAARAFTGRPKLALMEGGYHGSHDEFLGLNGRGDAYVPGLREGVVTVRFNDPESVTQAFDQNPNSIAAVIVEPVFSAGGQEVPEPGFLEHLRKVTAANGALLIFDEVVTFRLGPGGAQKRFGVTPDLTALGKVIGGGFPIGAFGGRREVMDVYSPANGDALPHHGTYNGNPISSAAGVAALYCLDGAAYERLEQIGRRFAGDVESIARDCEVDLKATGIGSLFSLHFGHPAHRSGLGHADGRDELASLLHLKLLTLGILSGSRGAIAFSSVTTDADLDDVAGALRTTVTWLRPALVAEPAGV